jgi:hypothetical protein
MFVHMFTRRSLLRAGLLASSAPLVTPLSGLAQPATTAEIATTKFAILLESAPSFARASQAVLAGLRAGHARESTGISIEHVPLGSGDPVQKVQELAQLGTRLVIGPLTRSAVNALADAGSLPLTVLALNQADADRKPPASMLQFGLPIEAEARQMARQAWADATAKPQESAPALVVLSDGTPLGKRSAQAFSETWQGLGGKVPQMLESEEKTAAPWRSLIASALNGVPVLGAFAAVSADLAKPLRNAIPREWMLYSTSHINTMSTNTPGRAGDLEGWKFTEMPWQVARDHPAVMTYPRSTSLVHLDYQRLYALGIDAYRIARELASRRNRFELDGVTGKLKIDLEATSLVERQSLVVEAKNASLSVIEPSAR